MQLWWSFVNIANRQCIYCHVKIGRRAVQALPKTIQCVMCELSCTHQSIANIVMSITNDIIVCFNYFSFLLPPAARAGGFACGTCVQSVVCFACFSFLLPLAARSGGFACGAWPPAVIVSVQIPLTWRRSVLHLCRRITNSLCKKELNVQISTPFCDANYFISVTVKSCLLCI